MSVTYGAVVGELCPKPRSGHVAIFCHGQMLIYGGICEESGSSYHSLDDLWSYNTDTCSWTFLLMKGKSRARKLSGSCGVYLNEHLILFGGFLPGFGTTSAVHCLDLKNLNWLDLDGKIHGHPPSRRDKLCCWTYKRQVYYFGGYGHMGGADLSQNGKFVMEDFTDEARQGFGWNSHLYILDCTSFECLKWKQSSVFGDIPCPRAAHASARIGNIGYLFGGRFKSIRRNDMYSLDLRDCTWTEIRTSCGPIPQGRSWHILESLGTSHLLLFGGLNTNGEPLHDFWIFDVASRIWSSLECKLMERMPRIWHTSTHSDESGEVLIFGGCTNSLLTGEPLNHSNSILNVRVSPPSLCKTCLDFIMQDISFYSNGFASLPRPLQRKVDMRLHALQFCVASGDSCVNTTACSVS